MVHTRQWWGGDWRLLVACSGVTNPAAAALATAVLKALTYVEPRERLMTPEPGGRSRTLSSPWTHLFGG